MTRITGWIFSSWLIVITLRYCDTAFGSLLSPITEGNDIAWALVWSVAAVGCLVSYTLPAQVLIALVILVASNAIIPFIFAAWLLVLCAGLGSLVLRFVLNIDSKAAGAIDQVVVAVPLGFAVMSLGVFTLGMLHVLTSTTLWEIVAIATIPAIRALKGMKFSIQGTEATKERRALLAVMGWISLLNVLWAVAPEIQYDALNYHLYMPRTYLLQAGFAEVPFFQAYFFTRCSMRAITYRSCRWSRCWALRPSSISKRPAQTSSSSYSPGLFSSHNRLQCPSNSGIFLTGSR